MGDFAAAPRRHREHAEAKERFIRRLDGYRKHHVNGTNKFDNYMNSVYEQQRQDTRHLHQSWLESKAKKAVKSKPARHCNVNHSAAPSMPANQKLGKPKSNEPGCLNGGSSKGPSSTAIPSGAGGCHETSSSVQIDNGQLKNSLQVNINLDANLQRTQSEITLKFCSTVNATKGVGVNNVGSDNNTVIVTTKDGNVCKSENGGGGDAVSGARMAPSPVPDNSEFCDIDDLPDFCMDDGADDFFNNLDFEFIQDSKLDVDAINCLGNGGGCGGGGELLMNGKENLNIGRGGVMYGNSGELHGASSFSDSFYGPSNLELFLGTGQTCAAPVTPLARSPMEPCPAGAAPPTPTLLGDTGPAAETLKQMAAQHQSLENAQYGMGMHHPLYGQPDGYNNRYQQQQPNGECYPPPYAGRGGYPIQQGMYGGGGATGYNGAQRTHHQTLAAGYMQGGQLVRPMTDAAMAYRSSKVLSRYAEPPLHPSSLQQLENQVHSHFVANGHGVATPPSQMIQNQVQPNDLQQQHFHMSQTQQLSLQGGLGGGGGVSGGGGGQQLQHLSMTQQQSITMTTADRRMTPVVAVGNQNQSSGRMKMQQQQQLYPSQQQSFGQSYANAVPTPPQYRMPSVGQNNVGTMMSSGSTMINQNLESMNVNNNKTMSNVVVNQDVMSSVPVMEQVYCGSPSVNLCPTGYPSNDQQRQMLANGVHVQQSAPNPTRYCHPTAKRDGGAAAQSQYSNGSMKRVQQRAPNVIVGPNGLNALNQRVHMSSGDWPPPPSGHMTASDQHRRMAAMQQQQQTQSDAVAMAMCRGGSGQVQPYGSYPAAHHMYGPSSSGGASVVNHMHVQSVDDRVMSNSGGPAVWSSLQQHQQQQQQSTIPMQMHQSQQQNIAMHHHHHHAMAASGVMGRTGGGVGGGIMQQQQQHPANNSQASMSLSHSHLVPHQHQQQQQVHHPHGLQFMLSEGRHPNAHVEFVQTMDDSGRPSLDCHNIMPQQVIMDGNMALNF